MDVKATGNDFDGRFREIIGDPLNLLIRRHPQAGTLVDGCVVLHNGHRVPVSGPGSYYDDFSRVLIYNRGVHEPLEEFAFQCLLPHLPPAPTMLELGAYWAHYSMWMVQQRPAAELHLIEPDANNLAAGKANFARHGYSGRFQQALVGRKGVAIDAYMGKHGLHSLTLLHCDIQGAEVEMLEGAEAAISGQRIDWLFISTHSQKLHEDVVERLSDAGYRIELSSDVARHTTSHDGFVMAAAPHCPTILADRPHPLGREEIVVAEPGLLLARLAALAT